MSRVPIPTEVPAEINCIECGYHLVGLAVASVCPECGTPIRRSFPEHLLRYEPIGWLSRVASGIRMWHAGISGMLALPAVGLVFVLIVGVLLAIRDPLFTRTADRIIVEVSAYIFLAALTFFMLLYVRGLWLMTTPLTDDSSVLGTVRGPARVLAVAAPFIVVFIFFTEDLGFHPIAAYVLDGITILALGAHVWTCGRMCEALAELVPSMTRKVRRRLRLARRDGWVVVTICALVLLFAGFNPILLVMFFYFLGTHGAFGALSNAVQLERLIALEHHTEESRSSRPARAAATD